MLKSGDNSKIIQPGAHAVYYAYHEPFPRWMFGDQEPWTEINKNWEAKIDEFVGVELARFSFQTVIENPIFVGYETHPEMFEIVWGPTDPKVVLAMTESRRCSLSITEQNLNLKPHIVS